MRNDHGLRFVGLNSRHAEWAKPVRAGESRLAYRFLNEVVVWFFLSAGQRTEALKVSQKTLLDDPIGLVSSLRLRYERQPLADPFLLEFHHRI